MRGWGVSLTPFLCLGLRPLLVLLSSPLLFLGLH